MAEVRTGVGMVSKAIRLQAHGGPEVLEWQPVEVPPPGPGDITVRHHAVGLNYIDVYHRNGTYPLTLPSGLGLEAAGEVEAVGEGVEGLRPGDRIVYAGGPVGAYAERRNLPADRAVPLPDGISFEMAAAVFLQGLTAQYLLRRTHAVQPGETILIHAAAGGVGLLVCQWARALGATVIGTVGSDEKAALARAHGCHHTLSYRNGPIAQQVRALTDGQGVHVVYDSVGRDTFIDSLDCLRPLGMMVLFGAASGPVPPFDPSMLAAKGSLFLTRPTLFTYTAARSDLMAMSSELFDQILVGGLRIHVGQRLALAEAATAHRALEARQTVGATVLLPG